MADSDSIHTTDTSSQPFPNTASPPQTPQSPLSNATDTQLANTNEAIQLESTTSGVVAITPATVNSSPELVTQLVTPPRGSDNLENERVTRDTNDLDIPDFNILTSTPETNHQLAEITPSQFSDINPDPPSFVTQIEQNAETTTEVPNDLLEENLHGSTQSPDSNRRIDESSDVVPSFESSTPAQTETIPSNHSSETGSTSSTNVPEFAEASTMPSDTAITDSPSTLPLDNVSDLPMVVESSTNPSVFGDTVTPVSVDETTSSIIGPNNTLMGNLPESVTVEPEIGSSTQDSVHGQDLFPKSIETVTNGNISPELTVTDGTTVPTPAELGLGGITSSFTTPVPNANFDLSSLNEQTTNFGLVTQTQNPMEATTSTSLNPESVTMSSNGNGENIGDLSVKPTEASTENTPTIESNPSTESPSVPSLSKDFATTPSPLETALPPAPESEQTMSTATDATTPSLPEVEGVDKNSPDFPLEHVETSTIGSTLSPVESDFSGWVTTDTPFVSVTLEPNTERGMPSTPLTSEIGSIQPNDFSHPSSSTSETPSDIRNNEINLPMFATTSLPFISTRNNGDSVNYH